MNWTKREDDFIKELARTTPFAYMELVDLFRNFCDCTDTSFKNNKKGFVIALELSQSTMTPLQQSVSAVCEALSKRISWFQRIKQWFNNLISKIWKWIKR